MQKKKITNVVSFFFFFFLEERTAYIFTQEILSVSTDPVVLCHWDPYPNKNKEQPLTISSLFCLHLRRNIRTRTLYVL